MRTSLDATVVGAGPNGLAAAIVLARAGRRVHVLESEATIGGGCRSAELIEPGVIHDLGAAVHPLGRASPLFGRLGLERHGVEWIEPAIQIAHPFDDRPAALAWRDVGRTAAGFGSRRDAAIYARWMGAAVARWPFVTRTLLGPLDVPGMMRDPLSSVLFGPPSLLPASLVARTFRSPAARALVAGCAAHSFLPLESPLSGSFGVMLLTSAHAVGWPIARGGSQRIVDALGAVLRSHGGTIETGRRVTSLADLEPSRATLLDLSPRSVLEVAGDRLPAPYTRRLRDYRYGPAAFKLDYVLDGPIPWSDPEVARAGTVHLGGTLEEIEASERAIEAGSVSERPFVLLAQPSLHDPSRAPAGRHVAWAYCHVPNGWRGDASDRIEQQIERFAPGFGTRVRARRPMGPAELEAYDANFVGGDINGGRMDWRQFFTRPAPRLDPYRTPDPGILICSASTPPGGGVHGICGERAARSALRGVLA